MEEYAIMVLMVKSEKSRSSQTQLYLDALKEVFYYQGSMGYKFETLSEDPEVRKSVSKLIADNF